MTTSARDMRAVLRTLPVLTGAAPTFNPDDVPGDPTALFVEWFDAAVQAGITEPHAMTLSTVDAQGQPDARVLILKDVDAHGWHFAVGAASPKGNQLAANPMAALTFYWPQQIRQVRIRGPVSADPPEVAAADLLARSAGARALVHLGRQSQPLADPTELTDALAKSRVEPTLIPGDWVSYAVRPQHVEFWQGDAERRHRRLLYTATAGAWITSLLWP